jgi:hypothetical protein
MNRKESQNRMTTLTDWLELFYLQAVLPEQNDIILLPAIKNFARPLFALNSAVWQHYLQAAWRSILT